MLSALLSNRKDRNRKLQSKSLAEEKDAKMDIYNYAARFDCVPQYRVRLLKSPIQHQPRKMVEVAVDMPEQNIHVVGRGLNSIFAETSAAQKFKRQAEMYHAQGEKGSIVVRDSEALTTANSKQFFDFYKVIYPRKRLKLEQELVKTFDSEDHKFQVSIDGELVGEPVVMRTKKNAEALAYLTAAIVLKKEQPDLYPRFLQAMNAGRGSILTPVPTNDMFLNDDVVMCMTKTLSAASQLGPQGPLSDENAPSMVDDGISKSRQSPRHLLPLSPEDARRRNSQMQDARNAYRQDVNLHSLRWQKSELPMNQYRAKVLGLINSHQYSIIVGATGSGKTTQVPQILLEEAIVNGSASACNIICTQPRRIAATSVARRVAQERAENLQETVGYQVRFDARLPSNRGSITFCTTGILMQQLQHAPDEIMNSVSHLIVDEVHERSADVDFLLVTLKRIIKMRTIKGLPSPKVVLMSATIDTDLFASYFSSGKGTADCPVLTVPGRTFPVKEIYLDTILNELEQSYPAPSLRLLHDDDPTSKYLTINDKFLHKQSATPASSDRESVIDWKNERKLSAEGEIIEGNEKDDAVVPNALVAATIAHITKKSDRGAILAFLPGLDEIVKVEELLTNTALLGINFKDESKFKIYMLHSSIAVGQKEVFEDVPRGCRKIILATNIAETSITIPEVQFVVDTGKVREKQYDQIRRITNLNCTWISKSNSKQRAGRAGRVQNGTYYALFPKECYDSMRASPLAELLRSDLQETCLAIKAQAFTTPIREFLAEAVEPPPPKAVDASVISLEALGALTSDEKLTALGKLLATLPVHPSLGKMIVLGVIFRCLDPILIIGAAASERPLFVQPLGRRREAQATKDYFAKSSGSDHIAILNAVREMRSQRHRFGELSLAAAGRQNYIHVGAFKSITSTAKQIHDILVDAGLIPANVVSASVDLQIGHPSVNRNSANFSLIKALTLAGLHPNLACSGRLRSLRTPNEKGVMIHPSSVNTQRGKNLFVVPAGTLYSYSEMAGSIDSSTTFIRDTTRCTPLMTALFGGEIKNPHSNSLVMDGWLPWFVKTESDSGSTSVKVIVNFRKQLERVLSSVFEDLSHTKGLEYNWRPSSPTVKLHKILSLFADGVVAALERDVRSERNQSPGQVQEEPSTPWELSARYSKTTRSDDRDHEPYNYNDGTEDNDDSRQDWYDMPDWYGSRHTRQDRGDVQRNTSPTRPSFRGQGTWSR